MTYDTIITVRGWVGSVPVRRETKAGKFLTDFRLASTPRFRNTQTGEWNDGQTVWYTVKVWDQDLVANVCESIRKSDPVLVQGRLRTSEWVGESGSGLTLEIHASTLGHDLSRGVARFARAVRHGKRDLSGSSDGGSWIAAAGSGDQEASDAEASMEALIPTVQETSGCGGDEKPSF